MNDLSMGAHADGAFWFFVSEVPARHLPTQCLLLIAAEKELRPQADSDETPVSPTSSAPRQHCQISRGMQGNVCSRKCQRCTQHTSHAAPSPQLAAYMSPFIKLGGRSWITA